MTAFLMNPSSSPPPNNLCKTYSPALPASTCDNPAQEDRRLHNHQLPFLPPISANEYAVEMGHNSKSNIKTTSGTSAAATETSAGGVGGAENDFGDQGEVEEEEEERGAKKKRGKKPNPLISATEKCKVCHEPAAKHIHYGAVTCFSCRAFFRRSIQNGSSNNYTCRRQGSCEINLKSRKNCQKCRFDHCLKVGMKPTWVLSEDERSRRFRKTREKKKESREVQESGTVAASDTISHANEEEQMEQHVGSSSLQYPPPHSKCPPPPCSHPPQTNSRSHRQAIKIETESPPLHINQLSTHQHPQNMVPAYPPLPSNQQPSTSKSIEPSHASLGPPQAPLYPQASAQYYYGYPSSAYMGSFYSHSSGSRPLFAGRSQQTLYRGGGTVGMGNLPPRFPLQFPGPHAYPGQHDLQRASMLPYGPYQSSQIFQSAGRPHDASFYHNQGVLKQRQDAEQYDSDDSSGSSQKVAREPILEISCDEIHQIRKITYEYDHHYKSISFGEELLKEMVMCSVFKIPLTSSAAMKAYRIMISRVTKVAQGFDHFLDMDHSTQAALLKENADLLVSLRGAVFFDDKKKGLDQILYSMGIDDVESGKKMIMVTLKNAGELGRIDYKNFNSLQKIEDNEVEDRYEQLLARVGSTVSLRPEIVKLFSYIILFSADFTQVNNRAQVEGVQGMLITMLKRFLLSQYSHTLAVSAFANILQTIGDLRELTHIKKKRAMAAAVTLNS